MYHYKVELAKPPPERGPSRLAETRAALNEQLRKLEAFLGDREFFVGNQYSVADVAVYAFLWSGEAVTGVNMVTDFPRLDRWYARLKAM